MGKGDGLAALDEAAQDRPWIDLAADRPIAADRLHVLQFRKLQNPFGDLARDLPPEVAVEGVAAREGLAPQRVLDGGRRGVGDR